MKKIFTLIAASMLALGASADSWVVPEEAPEAGATIVDNALMTAKTVYSTKVAADAFTYGGVDFAYRMQVRVADWPNADNLTGTDNGGSTPIVIEAKNAIDVTFAFRRQNKSGYTAGDGKDIAVFSHPDATKLAGEMVEANDLDGSFGNCAEKFTLQPGTYTVAAKGTTLGLFGFIYDYTTGVNNIAVDEANGEAVYYNLNGVRVANPANGLYIKVQGGKASKVLVK